MNLEAVGIPVVFVASTEFVVAAQSQAQALGAEPAAVFVPHPIQDRTDEELVVLARDAFAAIVEAVTTSQE